MNSKERFMAAIKGEEYDRVPVFPSVMHFAIKRYGANYRQFASDGKVMAECQLKFKEMFRIDAITSCSDAYRISADLGGDIIFPEMKPPYLARPLVRNQNDLDHLKKPDVSNPKGRMADRVKGVREMIKAVGQQCAVLGWVDMPFAEACAVCGVQNLMLMVYDNPKLLHKLLYFLTDIVIEFSLAQIEEGAPMIGAGDATASLLSPILYREFALPYEQRVCNAIHHAGALVKLHICGNTTHLLKDMIVSGADFFNIDHLVDFSHAAETYSKADKAFKGNLDPVGDMFLATPEECRDKAIRCMELAKGKKYMLSPGCEVPGDVTDEVFFAFCDAPDHVR